LSALKIFYWLLLGPVLALVISCGSWFVFEFFSPGKLVDIGRMFYAFPQGLLMSLLTPWGWLMYGGVIMMHSGKARWGLICTIIGSVILGLFWPVWSTFMLNR